MEISEKVAYLKGLAEGLALDTETKEGKLIAAIIDVLDEMSIRFEDIDDNLVDLEDGLDAVSDDLSEVEEALYEMDDDDEELDDDAEYFETPARSARRRSSLTRILWTVARSAAPTAAKSWSLTSAIWPGLRMTTTTRTNPMTEKRGDAMRLPLF